MVPIFTVCSTRGDRRAYDTDLGPEKGISLEDGVWEDYRTIKERQYDKLADTLREYLRMEEIYGMLREARIS